MMWFEGKDWESRRSRGERGGGKVRSSKPRRGKNIEDRAEQARDRAQGHDKQSETKQASAQGITGQGRRHDRHVPKAIQRRPTAPNKPWDVMMKPTANEGRQHERWDMQGWVATRTKVGAAGGRKRRNWRQPGMEVKAKRMTTKHDRRRAKDRGRDISERDGECRRRTKTDQKRHRSSRAGRGFPRISYLI